MIYRDPRIKLLQDKQTRCRSLVREISSLPWQRVQCCDLCGESPIAIIANYDRYGVTAQTAMCLRCRLVFLLDRLTANGYAEFYKNYYIPLVCQFHGRPFNPDSMQRAQFTYASRLIARLRPWLNRSSGQTLLDIGGSTGVVGLEFARQLGYDPTILDPAQNELEVARSKGLKVVQGFLETYQPDGQQFDLVLMCQTIDHLLELRTSLYRVGEVVKPDGYFFCDIVDFDEQCFWNGCIEGALHLDHCYYLSHETAVLMFAGLGWQVVSIDMATNRSGHVGYLLKKSDGVVTSIPAEGSSALRQLLRLQTQAHSASQQTYGMAQWAMKHAYRAKRYLSSLTLHL